MSGESNPQDDREVLQRGYAQLLAHLTTDPAAQGEALGRLRQRIFWLFQRWGCPFPEDLADEALERAAKRLGEGVEFEGEDIFGYVYGVARFMRQESVRGEIRERTGKEKFAKEQPTTSPAPSLVEAEGSGAVEALRQCLTALSGDERDMVLAYYTEEGGARIKTRAKLASRLGLSASGLRVKAYRLREKLERCLRKKLADPETDSGKPSLEDEREQARGDLK